MKQRYLFIILLLIFIASRLWGLLAFPIVNDEAIYLNYSQLMHKDFGAFKYISMDNALGDWKPPLQYWFGSLFIGSFQNPLFAGRLASVIFSTTGFTGIYLLARKIYGGKEAFLTGVIAIILPPMLMYDTQYIAETYVITGAVFFYLFCLLSCEGGCKYIYLVPAALSGAAMLLSKQSGLLFLYLSPVAAFIPLDITEGKRTFFSRLVKNLAATAVAAFASVLIYRSILPTDLLEKSGRYTGNWTASVSEILGFPLSMWAGNARIIYEFYSHYYTLALVPVLTAFMIFSLYKKSLKDISVSLLFILSSMAVIIGLKMFNEYLYHTAASVFIVLMAARFLPFLIAWIKPGNNAFKRAASGVLIALCVFSAVTWTYKSIVLKTSPVRYVQSGSPWMTTHYGREWPTGFGIRPLVEYLKKQEGPAIAFLDAQWGNPGTSVLVFNSYYPDIVLTALNNDIFNPELRQRLTQRYKKRLIIFSDRKREDAEAFNVIKSEICVNRMEFGEFPGQTPIFLCEF